jgi:hypothetical protein
MNALSIVISSKTGTVYVSSYNGSVTTVYRSSDDGLTWTPVAIYPGWSTNPVPICASSVTGTAYAAYGNSGLYRSTNDGLTWDRVTGVPSYLGGVNPSVVISSATGTLYASSYDGSHTILYRSSDDGLTWDRESRVTGVLLAPRQIGQPWLALSAANTLVVSADDGLTWNACTDRSVIVYGLSLSLNGDGNPVLLNQDGIRYTTDGHVWTLSPYLGISVLGTVSSSGMLPAVVANGVVWLNSSGAIVSGPGSGLGQDIRAVVTDPAHANRAWAAGPSAAGGTTVYVTVDGGDTWAASGEAGLTSSGNGIRLSVDQAGTTLLAAAGTSVVRSVDGGLTWSSANVELPSGMSIGSLGCVAGRFYLSGLLLYPTSLYCSVNGGQSWFLAPGSDTHAYSYYGQSGAVARDAAGDLSWWLGLGWKYGKLAMHTVTSSASERGSISPVGNTFVQETSESQNGYPTASRTFIITPDAGFTVDDVLVDDLSVRERLQPMGGGAVQLTLNDIRADHSVEARFRGQQLSFSLSTSVSGAGSVNRNPDLPSYGLGTVVTLTATADPGHVFVSWTGATPVSGHPEQATVTMDTDRTVTATFIALTATPGDVNGDGTVTMLDALLAARAAVGITTLTESAFVAADVNHDGTITMLDVLLIARIAVGISG